MLPRHTWLAGLIAAGALLPQTRAGATQYALDPQRTVVSFEMRGLGTTQRGEFTRAAGSVMLDSAAQRGEVDIVIDARSLEAGNAAMGKFVRGPSMLNTAAHPEIAYKAQRIVFSEGRPARIEGELTLLGITRSVALEISRYVCTTGHAPDERCSIIATAGFKRSAFGMTRYRMFASDDVQLTIHAEGVSSEGRRTTPEESLAKSAKVAKESY
jgi:polyisoprenoid-binding protein YceI